MAATIVLLHVVGLTLLLAGSGTPDRTAALGLALTAYTLGLRHAFDADHIAAIDNTTRKLVADHRRPASVGFWFSLGHSTVVFGLTLALALGAHALAGAIRSDTSTLHQVTGVVGTTVSAAFLYTIAAINVVALVAGVRRMRAARSGTVHADEPDQVPGGPLTRVFGRVMRWVRHPWQMYPLGLLFGLGFDTATEVGLLAVAATSAVAGLPWYAVLALPLLFAAGMSLLDTADGLVMRFAYGWALQKPDRRARYNLTVTGLSVAVALVIGSVEIVGLLGERLDLTGTVWRWATSLDLNAIGFGVGALLLLVWLAALAASAVSRSHGRAGDALPPRSPTPPPMD